MAPIEVVSIGVGSYVPRPDRWVQEVTPGAPHNVSMVTREVELSPSLTGAKRIWLATALTALLNAIDKFTAAHI